MNRKEALYLLQPVMSQLQPHCQKIELAGDLRRGAAEVIGATILCIPQMVRVPHQESLFGGAAEKVEVRDPKFCEVVDSLTPLYGTSLQLRFSRLVGGLHIFFHVVQENSWGLMLHQLSGTPEYNDSMRRRLESFGYRLKDDQLLHNGRPVAVPDEQTLYRFAQLPYTPPEMRHRLEIAVNR